MSINKLISIRTPIVDALELCGADHDKDIPVLMRWAILAEKDISSYYQYVRKIAVLDITNCTACLPDDAAYLQRAMLGDYGCDCGDLFQKYCFQSQMSSTTINTSPDQNSFLIVDIGQASSFSVSSVPHEVQGNKIIFATNLDAQKVTIQYLAYDTDCDGFLNISENHVQAITYNLCWKYYLRKKKKSNDDFAMVNKYEAYWHRECANARARDGVLTESERDKIVARHHDPYIGIGLGLGMNTTLGNYRW
jgi:hypothetical protein